MTLAERLKQDGFEKGIEQGRELGIQLKSIAIANKLLATGADPKFVAHITDLPLTQVQELQVTTEQAVADA